MTFFANCQGFEVNGGQLTATSITTNNYQSGPTGIDILREASTPEAAHDSSARAYSPRCFPGTRKQYIEDIKHWVIPPLGDTPAPIYWMRGPAGVGKSAIAQTCAEELQELGVLGAAFFFSISERDKPETFFPSIAYQLSTIHPPYRDLIDDRIRHDKTLVNKAMAFQFRYLIHEPLRELALQGRGIEKRTVVFIDGLDECKGVDAQCDIIRIIAAAVSDDTVPLCWVFFSRPEPHIEATFARTTISRHCHKIILPLSSDANKEIALYLRNGFENILRRHHCSMQTRWPSAGDMKILVIAADGSFIYATTVIRFVGHLDSLGPHKRLCAIIDVILDRRKRDPHAGTSTARPFAELDAFYTLILKRIPKQIFPSVHLLLALLCRIGGASVIIAANLLGLSKSEFEIVCNYASAVVHLQVPGKDLELDPTIDTRTTYTEIDPHTVSDLTRQVLFELEGQVSFYHKSFDDFLLDPARSGSYYVKASEVLTQRFLEIHLDYDRSFCWNGSELALAPGVRDSASSHSYPYTNELVDSLLKAFIYYVVGAEDAGGYSVWLDASCDFRKRLYVCLASPRPVLRMRWGCGCLSKSFSGTRITQISRGEFSKFNLADFKLIVKRFQQANIIRRYHPNLTSRLKSLFCRKSRKRVECALYRIGHGEKSIFWYWEVNYKLRRYREFQAISLEEGEKVYRAEDFDAWSDSESESDPEREST